MEIKKHPQLLIHLLKDKPHAVGAEVGIFVGRCAEALLKNLPGIETYYCIDPWDNDESYRSILKPGSAFSMIPPEEAYAEFIERTDPYATKRVILAMTSMDALFHVEDESLDWVFIDGNHSYEYVKPDIIEWSKKVKPGGLIAGHDFEDRAPKGRPVPFGVDRAVKELITNFEVRVNTWYTWKEN